LTDLSLVPLYYSNRIDRIVPVPTPGMEFKHLAQAIQEAYNDFKNSHKFREYEETLVKRTGPHHAKEEKRNRLRLNYYKLCFRNGINRWIKGTKST
jgi:hypothetical protein